jgi:hypothetical protein
VGGDTEDTATAVGNPARVVAMCALRPDCVSRKFQIRGVDQAGGAQKGDDHHEQGELHIGTQRTILPQETRAPLRLSSRNR